MPNRWIAALGTVVAASVLVGCDRRSPRNPILENSQAHLAQVESRLHSKPPPGPTHADYLALGKARYRVWDICLARSRYPAGSAAARRNKSRKCRRMAERLLPQMLDAFRRAMDEPPDPRVAAQAKFWLAQVYSRIPDTEKQIAMLQRMLKDHGELEAPEVFGLGWAGRPTTIATIPWLPRTSSRGSGRMR